MFHKKILDVVHDREHGSSELLNMVLSAIDEFRDGLTPIDINWALGQLEEMEKSMVVIQHFVNQCRSLEGQDFLENFESYKKQWSSVQQTLSNQFKKHYDLSGKNVLTHSRSSSVLNVLKSFPEAQQVYQTESQPGGEGVLQADQLSKLGIQMVMVKDDEVETIMSHVDICIFGCDQHAQDGFINKVGTKEIAALAVGNNIPVVVLSDTRKEVSQLSNISPWFEKIGYTPDMTLVTEQGVHMLNTV
ncbi:MAG: hypothetical protein RIG77_06290 [Cyclobacteriaceae bacterium]